MKIDESMTLGEQTLVQLDDDVTKLQEQKVSQPNQTAGYPKTLIWVHKKKVNKVLAAKVQKNIFLF